MKEAKDVDRAKETRQTILGLRICVWVLTITFFVCLGLFSFDAYKRAGVVWDAPGVKQLAIACGVTGGLAIVFDLIADHLKRSAKS